ncbi:MAG: PIN domain-containing protein, partial [Streptosporangiaceae bacterium]
VMTPGYGRLLSIAGTMTGSDIATQRVLNGMVSLELSHRVEDFAAAVKALEEEIGRWARPGVLVVADTSFYIQHPDKLEELDFRPLLEIWEDPVRLLVPIVVVDELDGLKKSKGTQERWRPLYTLAVIDRILANPPGPAELAPQDFSALGTGGIPRGAVTMELVFDPPGTSACRSTTTRSSTGSW